MKTTVEGDVDLVESEGDSAIHRIVLALERRLTGETIAALGVMPGDNVTD